MKVCIADADSSALTTAGAELASLTANKEHDVLTFTANVANLADVQAFKKEIIAKFGEV
jgi:NAD(P)-dependent dehydrogenase (short-subunit alcohol dehydrogenase family)